MPMSYTDPGFILSKVKFLLIFSDMAKEKVIVGFIMFSFCKFCCSSNVSFDPLPNVGHSRLQKHGRR